MNRSGLVGGVLALLAMVVPAMAQEEDETLTIMPTWEQGDRICFDLDKSRTMFRSGRELPTVSSHSHNSFEILSDDDDYVVRWTVHNVEIESAIPMDDLVKRISTIATEHPMEFVFGRDAISLQRLQNFDELKDLIEATIAKLTPLLQAKGMPKPQVDQIMAGVAQMFSDNVTAAAMMSQDIAGMFMPYGYEFFVDYGTQIDTRIPNPAGGEALAAVETWFIAEPNPAEPNMVTIEWAQTIEPEEMTRFARELLAMMGQADAADNVAQAIEGIEMIRQAEYHYDREKELLTAAYIVSENLVMDSGRIETWEWTVVECDEEH